jgi:hypothetical protein
MQLSLEEDLIKSGAASAHIGFYPQNQDETKRLYGK